MRAKPLRAKGRLPKPQIASTWIETRLPRLGHADWRVAVKLRVELFQTGDLRQIVNLDIQALGMMNEVILVIAFRQVEPLRWLHPRHDGGREGTCFAELRDVSAGHLLLHGRCKEYLR